MKQPEILGIHHVSLVVADTDRALAFYSGLFGIRQADRPAMAFAGAWLQIGHQQIHLLELENPDPVSGRPDHGGRDRHIAVTVSDLEAVITTLDAAGIAYALSSSGRRALFCRDPDGNALEVVEV